MNAQDFKDIKFDNLPSLEEMISRYYESKEIYDTGGWSTVKEDTEAYINKWLKSYSSKE